MIRSFNYLKSSDDNATEGNHKSHHPLDHTSLKSSYSSFKLVFCGHLFFKSNELFFSSQMGEISISAFEKRSHNKLGLFFIKACGLKIFNVLVAIKYVHFWFHSFLLSHIYKFSSRFVAFLTVAIFIYSVNVNTVNAKECTGHFVNPITDVCWECLFPMTLGGIELYDSGVAPDTKNASSPVCMCDSPVRVGIIGSFWEPVRLVDVSHEPYCFSNMGGMKMEIGVDRNQTTRGKAASSKTSRWYVHYYMYPLLYWLELFTDFVCLERGSFDIAYLSELDPLALDDDLSAILHPEAFLYNNVTAQAACAADCLSANTNLARDEMHWCSGCQGSMYPLNNNINGHVGGVQASINATERLLYKMHRTGLADETAGQTMRDICHKHKSFIMKKSHYRYQMTNPIPDKCQNFGKSTMTFEAMKEMPRVGEDFGYLIWRKRACCII